MSQYQPPLLRGDKHNKCINDLYNMEKAPMPTIKRTSSPKPRAPSNPLTGAGEATTPSSASKGKHAKRGHMAQRAPAPKLGEPERKLKVVSGKQRAKLVRDGFTMPESDFALLAMLKQTALDAKRDVKKSELLRAGLRVLAALEPKALLAALDRLEPVKVGRPKKVP